MFNFAVRGRARVPHLLLIFEFIYLRWQGASASPLINIEYVEPVSLLCVLFFFAQVFANKSVLFAWFRATKMIFGPHCGYLCQKKLII